MLHHPMRVCVKDPEFSKKKKKKRKEKRKKERRRRRALGVKRLNTYIVFQFTIYAGFHCLGTLLSAESVCRTLLY